MQMVAMIGVAELASSSDKQQMASYSRFGCLLLNSAGAVLLPCHAFVVGSAAASAGLEPVVLGIMHGLIRVALGEIFVANYIIHIRFTFRMGSTRCSSGLGHLSHGPWP